MSEPVTNLEVEDVLSSIRRLVSEELPVEQAAPSKDAEKFVLTPALRVAEPDDAAPLFQHHGSSHSHDHSEQTESEPQSNDHHGETEAEAITEALNNAFSHASQCWQKESEQIHAFLHSGGLSKTSYKPEKVERLLALLQLQKRTLLS